MFIPSGKGQEKRKRSSFIIRSIMFSPYNVLQFLKVSKTVIESPHNLYTAQSKFFLYYKYQKGKRKQSDGNELSAIANKSRRRKRKKGKKERSLCKLFKY